MLHGFIQKLRNEMQISKQIFKARPEIEICLSFVAYANETTIQDSSEMASDPDTGQNERELLELMRAEEDEIK